jgi:endoglucanase
MIKERHSSMNTVRSLLLAVVCLGTASLVTGAENDDIFAAAKILSRGVNLGNALEAPAEGDWGLTLKAEYFDEIARAGFNSVRVPIRWSSHAQAEPPYTIDPKFFERIDWVIEQSLSRKLAVVVNVHHYEEMDRDPENHLPRLVALWRQIAERYRKRPPTVFFELLNEPHEKLTDELWNEMIPGLLRVIRQSNPERAVIVGPGHWNGIHSLEKLEIPESDRRLIVTFHYYEPHHFTHQGAPWDAESEKWKGQTWTATEQQLEALRKDFDKAAAWGKKHERPLYLGEFGSYEVADTDSRVAWTRAVAGEVERREISWCYWEFGAGFGVFDRQKGKWHDRLRQALLNRQ